MTKKLLNLKLSNKQYAVIQDILSEDFPELYILGSVQSGKNYAVALGTILYAQKLHQYDPNTYFSGACIGWSVDNVKANIVEVIQRFLNKLGFIKKEGNKKGDYVLKYGADEKFIQLWNFRLYFCSFNNVLSFNKILGRPLIFIWVDESARIYTQIQLQKSFNELPGRQVAYTGHPFIKTIHTFNVEGGENHPYKKDYIDGKIEKKHYTFFPYDNPVLNTEEKIRGVVQNTFSPGSLRDQKIFNQWCVAEGKVFTKLNIINSLDEYMVREIGIGIDYGSVNPTTFVPIALALNKNTNMWKLIRLPIYYHDPAVIGDIPTTEYFSLQLRKFLVYLKRKYINVPILDVVLDSEAAHYANRLETDNIPFTNARKGAGSVDEGVQQLQALIYKNYFLILKGNSVKHIRNDGTPDFTGKDEGLVEMESYQYDTVQSMRTGENCYKKELNHSIDGTRYLLQYWQDNNKCPVV